MHRPTHDGYLPVPTNTTFNGGFVKCYPSPEEVIEDFQLPLLDNHATAATLGSYADHDFRTVFSPQPCSQSPMDGRHGYEATGVTGHGATALNGSINGYGGSQMYHESRANNSLEMVADERIPEFMEMIGGLDTGMSSLSLRKQKMYELNPQPDLNEEKRRQRAIKAKKNRMKQQQLQQSMKDYVATTEEEVKSLQQTKQLLGQSVRNLEAQLLAAANQHGQQW